MRQTHINTHNSNRTYRKHNSNKNTKNAIQINTSILCYLTYSYRDHTINDFYADQYNNQATGKDDHADADHL